MTDASYRIAHAADNPRLHAIEVIIELPEEGDEQTLRAAFSEALLEIAARVENGED